jgi:phage N-6-adenine-methyltransferase
MNVHFMSDKDDWGTPQKVFDLLDAEFNFTLDPCASESNAKCPKFYTRKEDGLSQSWANEIVFMNPPYGKDVAQWMEKAYSEASATVVCLVSARTDTRWWHKFCMKANEIRLFDHRLEFEGTGNKAPFPSALIVFKAGQRGNGLQVTGYSGR